MDYCFAKTAIGYQHSNNKQVCQDHSLLFKDNNRKIITCCDGHGGNIYIRSSIGSKLASIAIFNIFANITPQLFRLEEEELENQIKLQILCEWNKLVEQDLANKPLKKSEIDTLTDEEIDTLKNNFVKAYGTTLSGALQLGNKLLVVGIGDTEAMIIKNGQIGKVFDNDDDPAANVTYSMCQEDAFKYIRVKLLEYRDVDGILLCTDGLTGPYQSYYNFNESFIKPMIKRLLDSGSLNHIDTFIDDVASHLGVGDDVSLAFIMKDKVARKYYR